VLPLHHAPLVGASGIEPDPYEPSLRHRDGASVWCWPAVNGASANLARGRLSSTARCRSNRRLSFVPGHGAPIRPTSGRSSHQLFNQQTWVRRAAPSRRGAVEPQERLLGWPPALTCAARRGWSSPSSPCPARCRFHQAIQAATHRTFDPGHQNGVASVTRLSRSVGHPHAWYTLDQANRITDVILEARENFLYSFEVGGSRFSAGADPTQSRCEHQARSPSTRRAGHRRRTCEFSATQQHGPLVVGNRALLTRICPHRARSGSCIVAGAIPTACPEGPL
jgi:hypothetical protein